MFKMTRKAVHLGFQFTATPVKYLTFCIIATLKLVTPNI